MKTFLENKQNEDTQIIESPSLLIFTNRLVTDNNYFHLMGHNNSFRLAFVPMLYY